MAGKMLPREQVEALEKILGVKLPEGEFTLEIKPLAAGELEMAQLDAVAGGGAGLNTSAANAPTRLHIISTNWSAKI